MADTTTVEYRFLTDQEQLLVATIPNKVPLKKQRGVGFDRIGVSFTVAEYIFIGETIGNARIGVSFRVG